jgi:hypothetical protein
MTRYRIDHIEINKHYEVMADNEQDAWEYFLDNLLSINDMAEDYMIEELKK